MFRIPAQVAKAFAIVWLVFISVMFFLPGSALPKADWLDKIYFDKWVHTGFFFVLLFTWRFYFPIGLKYNWLLLLISFFYGLGVEVIQHFFVANRSFDLGDVLADMTGAVLGVWAWVGYIKK